MPKMRPTTAELVGLWGCDISEPTAVRLAVRLYGGKTGRKTGGLQGQAGGR